MLIFIPGTGGRIYNARPAPRTRGDNAVKLYYSGPIMGVSASASPAPTPLAWGREGARREEGVSNQRAQTIPDTAHVEALDK